MTLILQLESVRPVKEQGLLEKLLRAQEIGGNPVCSFLGSGGAGGGAQKSKKQP